MLYDSIVERLDKIIDLLCADKAQPEESEIYGIARETLYAGAFVEGKIDNRAGDIFLFNRKLIPKTERQQVCDEIVKEIELSGYERSFYHNLWRAINKVRKR